MTPLAFKVLRALADGAFHSGTELGAALEVTRGTIWNAVRNLAAAGVDIYCVRGRGYRLAEPVSLLDAESILRHAQPCAHRFTLEVVDVTASTNTLLMQRAALSAATGSVIAAEQQVAGRGRMGRVWHSGVGGAITFSLLWRFERGASALAGLSLAAGVGLVRAAHGLGAPDVQLKWPNDVLWRGGKLAGMLIEMHGDALGPSAVVIGIGLNVRLSAAVRQRIDQPAADLERACGRALDRSVVLGRALAELAAVLDLFARDGFAPLRKEWERYHAHQNKSVLVTLPNRRVEEGVARGVAEDGALLFQTGEAVRRLHSGEISVREASSHGSGTPARERA